MWQGKSMLPKPKLSTPRRHAAASDSPSNHAHRTPSRLPRPLFNSSASATRVLHTNPARSTPAKRLPQQYHSTDHSSKSLFTSHSNVALDNARGDILAEKVISSGMLTDSAHQPTSSHYDNAYSLDKPKEFASHQRFDHQSPEYGGGSPMSRPGLINEPLHHVAQTPPRFRTPLSTPQRDSRPQFYTPHGKTPRGETGHLASRDAQEIDEELVTRTPAKHKNREWLASFGIDISLLKVTDDDRDEENHDPNITPSREFRMPESDTMDLTPEAQLVPLRTSQRRRATDFYGSATSFGEGCAGPPARVASARKSRRASARISVRELEALRDTRNFQAEHNKEGLDGIVRGSDVFLTPVRANRKQRETNGTPLVLSEVRRSLRINTPSSNLVPKNSVRGRIELLEANDHSYIPNPNLSD